MADEFHWDAPPLSAEDERLVNAYMEVGRALDDLPHTDDFTKLVELLGEKDGDKAKHHVFKRLLTLRKRGRLPHVVARNT